MSHLSVAKTYKLFIGGAFPRSESGRTYQAHDHKDNFMANAALASRKDLRDAVVAARKGYAAWSKATPYNRGQVIYRMDRVVGIVTPQQLKGLQEARRWVALLRTGDIETDDAIAAILKRQLRNIAGRLSLSHCGDQLAYLDHSPMSSARSDWESVGLAVPTTLPCLITVILSAMACTSRSL